jgi:predicted choloylglycine hydrolase
VRNYDYHPRWFEGTMLYTEWLQPVIAITDCSWGVLDGMNASGLSASLAFGGRKWSGEGFGIPLILRYLLETCSTVAEATAVLKRLPIHMTYNVALLDRSGDHAAVFVGPDRTAGVLPGRVTANHQETIAWPEYVAVTHSVERESAALALLEADHDDLESVIEAFLAAPLYSANYQKGFGTLYTSAWSPTPGEVCVAWRQTRLVQSFERFEERHVVVNLRAPIASKFAR